MAACPQCDTPLGDPPPALCPSCGASLGEPPRRRSTPAAANETAPEVVLFEGSPAAVPGLLEALLTVLTLGLALLYFIPKARSTRYRLTSQRVVVEHGLVDKKIEQVDLFRVVDFVVELPFAQRLLGTGNLVLECQDRTLPTGPSGGKELRIDRVRTDVRALYEQLRTAAQAERDRRGVRTLDPL